MSEGEVDDSISVVIPALGRISELRARQERHDEERAAQAPEASIPEEEPEQNQGSNNQNQESSLAPVREQEPAPDQSQAPDQSPALNQDPNANQSPSPDQVQGEAAPETNGSAPAQDEGASHHSGGSSPEANIGSGEAPPNSPPNDQAQNDTTPKSPTDPASDAPAPDAGPADAKTAVAKKAKWTDAKRATAFEESQKAPGGRLLRALGFIRQVPDDVEMTSWFERRNGKLYDVRRKRKKKKEEKKQ